MYWKNPGDVTFQVTVGRLKLSSRLPKEDIRVTVRVGDISKITCPGQLSWHSKRVTWNHPFIFSAPLSMPVGIAVYILPEVLSAEWNKQPLGDEIVTDVASLLETGKFKYAIPGLSLSHATLSVMSMTSDALVVPDGHDCLSALKKYKKRLYGFGRQFKNGHCISTKIEVDLARLDLCPLGHADHTSILNDLAISFAFRYDEQGNSSDLNRAVELKQTRLDLCPLGHPEHTKALGELAIVLWRHYAIQRNQGDLNRLIEMQQRWLDLCPLWDTHHSKALGELAVSLLERYYTEGNIIDLNRSIEMEEQRLDLCPAGHSIHDTALNNLALSIKARYQKQGDLTDLDTIIDLQKRCLELRPSGHQKHGLALQNLAGSYLDHYDRVKDYSDLTMAIKLFKEALNTYPVEHPQFAHNAQYLAATLLLSFTASQRDPSLNQPLHSLDEVFETYQLLKNCGPAVSLSLLEALQDWVENAEKHNHSSVLEAYQTLLTTLDHFTSLTSSLDSRHETAQKKLADVANDAFSCATRDGDFRMAVEFLEQGRGILWNQLARFDVSIAALESQGNPGYELGKSFTRLSADLRKHAQRQRGGGKDTDPYWRTHEEWQSVVDKIRRLDGFSRFLLPPHFRDLRRVAERGPVIIVNASKHACDALIVLLTGTPIHVPLPCSFEDVTQLCLQLSELTQDPHAYGDHRESWVKQTLRELWSSVVEPIASVLQNKIQLPPGSRIWWCPTSIFTALPLHAAGPHQRGKKNLLDIYISSYAPSLSALLRAQNRIRAQRALRDASGKANTVSFAAVGQGFPSADMKLGELPEVEREIQKICKETAMPPNVTFKTVTGAAATIDGAVQAFRDHHWVHLACHGKQHAEKPFESWFAMGDGKLTLMRIIQERYTNSKLAFLSACHTAVGDASTPDEVLHLAAGMQFAGFNGVIGTLWKVDDAVAHKVVTRFYKEMFKRPNISFEHAAAALNAAVLATANEVSLEKRIVFVHIGI